jgi:hypothetical protein
MDRSGKVLANQVSDTLDLLLIKKGYNKQIRPPGDIQVQ